MLLKSFFAVLLTTLSLSAKAGGDYYRIFLNNKLILERNMMEALSLKELPIENTAASDQLVVYFSHCGAIGKGRTLTLRDENGKVVKEWKFADTDDKKASMKIPVRELVQLKKHHKGVLNLHYAAKELPKGVMIAGVSTKAASRVGV